MSKRIVGYYQSWSYYRPLNGKFTVDRIDTKSYTHLIYAFFGIDCNGEIIIKDAYLNLSSNYGLGNIEKFNSMPKGEVKTLASVGGYDEGSTNFSQVAANPEKRRTFAMNARKFCKDYQFDGLDISWLYPTQGEGSSPDDKANFICMLQELYQQLKHEGYLLSVAVAASSHSAEIYDIPNIAIYVDFINVMTYDFHGSWENTTGHNAPMLVAESRNRTPAQSSYNVYGSIMHWLKYVPKHKINIGIPFYGRTFTLSDKTQTHVGANSSGAGCDGIYTKQKGIMGYNEICENDEGTDYWDDKHQVPYKISGNQWISYDNEQSVKIKSIFAKDNDLGGIMVWSIDMDNFRDRRNSLIEVIKSNFFDKTQFR